MRSDRPPRAIPLCVPEVGERERRYLLDCVDSGWVSSAGPFVKMFEARFARLVGAPDAVAVSSGTAALHLALLIAGVGPDDEVLMPALTFIAPANAVRYVGAWPRFIDVDPTYWQLDVERVAEFLRHRCVARGGGLVTRDTGRRIRALLPVHILGNSVDMNPLLAEAQAFDLAVIEDATESLGARYGGRPVGLLGDVGCFSFNGNKLITTGGGGIIVSKRKEWLDRARYLSTQARDDPLEYVHEAIGYNYRLTNVQAAIGCAQLERFDDLLRRKRAIAGRYADAFRRSVGVRLVGGGPWGSEAAWLNTIAVTADAFGCTSRQLIAALAAQDIEARPLWQPLHLSAPHRSPDASCPNSVDAYRDGVSLPSSVGLTLEEQRRVIQGIRAASAVGKHLSVG